MASIVTGLVEEINLNDTAHAIASTAYGFCETPASTQIKNVDMTGFVLKTGITVHIKFKYRNSAENPKLKFNGEDNSNAKDIVQYGTTAVGTSSATSGWQDNAVVSLTYDGTRWIRDQGYNATSFVITANATDGLWDLTGTGGNNEVTYGIGAYNDRDTTNNSARFYTGTSNPQGTTRLNYDGYFYATKLYSSGSEVITQSAIATSSALGVIKPWISHTASSTGLTAATTSDSIAVNAISTTTGRYYALEVDKDGRGFINVPWTDTTYSNFIGSGSSAAAGLVPSPGTTSGNTKFLCEDGTWETPPQTTSLPLSSITSAQNLQAIEALEGIEGFLKKTSSNTWTLDTNTYATSSHNHDTIYAPINSPELTGVPTSVTPTSSSDEKMIATKEYVDGLLTAADALVFKGVLDGAATTSNNGAGGLTPAAGCGDTYKVAGEGYINGLPVEVGDLLICLTNNTPAATASGTNIYSGSAIQDNWVIIQNNIDGAVFKGANTFTSDHVIIADGSNGKVKDSGFTIESSVPSGAVFTDEKLKTIVSSTGTIYPISSTSDTGTTSGAVIDTNFKVNTSNTAGSRQVELVLGNSTETSSSGGRYGSLSLYSTGTKGTTIKAADNSTDWYTVTVPAKNGTLVTGTTSTTTNAIAIYSDTAATLTDSLATIDSSGNITATSFIGSVTGNADTATAWTSAQTVYVDLTTSGTDSTLTGGSSSAEVLKVNGILPVENGGTGVSSFTDGYVVYPSTTNNIQTLVGNSNFVYSSTSHVLTLGKLTITGGTVDSSLSTTGNFSIDSDSSKTIKIQSGSTLYLTTKSSESIVFSINGTSANKEVARFNTSGNFIPYVTSGNTKSAYQLGDSYQHWKALFVGNQDQYGDAYTPIYWNNGVPEVVTIIQKEDFSLTTSNNGSYNISSNTSSGSHVIEIVVTSGYSSLLSSISYTVNNSNTIDISATVDGTVSGYILYTK